MKGERMPVLRVYAWVFLLSGAAFVAAPGLVLEGVGLAAAFVPRARPLSGAEPSYWLVLTGSMMAMIAFLARRAADDPRDATAWTALLLSKGASTALFAVFAVVEANALFLVGAVVDGTILLHLALLRRRAGAGYSVWFLKCNDPKTRDALWARYTTLNGAGTCWYALFDAAEKTVRSGRWEVPAAEIPDDLAAAGTARAEGPEASWELAWTRDASPPFAFVPKALAALGLAGTVYETPVSSGRFSGTFRLGGKRWEFANAPGCVGRLRGRRMGDNWRWAHAVFDDGTVFEILSAQARWGFLRSPRVTVAHLWRGGRHEVSAGLARGLANGTEPCPGGWRFHADFGAFAASGECAVDPAMMAVVGYTDTDGSRLRCANSKTAGLRLTLAPRGEGGAVRLETKDAAAVETVSRPGGSFCARRLLPVASACAILADCRIGDDALEEGLARRLGMLPPHGRAAAALGAVFVRRVAPPLFLGRWTRFDALGADDADRLLERLQASPSLLVKCLFYPLRAAILPELYGRPERTRRFGYGGRGAA